MSLRWQTYNIEQIICKTVDKISKLNLNHPVKRQLVDKSTLNVITYSWEQSFTEIYMYCAHAVKIINS